MKSIQKKTAIILSALSLMSITYWLHSKRKKAAVAINTVSDSEVKNFGLSIYNETIKAGSVMTEFTSTSGVRGIRNNNPGNIRLGANWQGMRPEQTDGAFVQFVDPKYGIRAMTRIIDNYKKRGVKTIAQIISTWAPPVENNTNSYINSVIKKTGWPSVYIPDKTKGDYLPLIKAIIFHENGEQPYSDLTIVEGIGMA